MRKQTACEANTEIITIEEKTIEKSRRGSVKGTEYGFVVLMEDPVELLKTIKIRELLADRPAIQSPVFPKTR